MMEVELVVLEAANPMAALKRRQVAKREWKVTIYELIESERQSLQTLRAIGNRHPSDAETQRLVSTGALEAAERMAKLNELLHYKEGEQGNGGCA
jgi:hypothetical protein